MGKVGAMREKGAPTQGRWEGTLRSPLQSQSMNKHGPSSYTPLLYQTIGKGVGLGERPQGHWRKLCQHPCSRQKGVNVET